MAETFIPLTRAARQLNITVDQLCNVIAEEKIPVYADPEYLKNKEDDPVEMTQIKLSSIKIVLDKNEVVDEVVFLYPPKYKNFRGNVKKDEQQISRSDLHLTKTDIVALKSQLKNLDFDRTSNKNTTIKAKSSLIESETGEPNHWQRAHTALLQAANLELKKNYMKYARTGGSIFYARLAKFLDENRKLWKTSTNSHSRELQLKKISELLSEFNKQGKLWSPKLLQ